MQIRVFLARGGRGGAGLTWGVGRVRGEGDDFFTHSDHFMTMDEQNRRCDLNIATITDTSLQLELGLILLADSYDDAVQATSCLAAHKLHKKPRR